MRRFAVACLASAVSLGCDRVCGDAHPEWARLVVEGGVDATPDAAAVDSAAERGGLEDAGDSEGGGVGEPSFFVTSVGRTGAFEAGATDGGGGMVNAADALCESLAVTIRTRDRDWRAYLSVVSTVSIDARDRIGGGPWYNVARDLIANDVVELHANNNIDERTALTESGEPLELSGANDIFTGSDSQGMAVVGEDCSRWTEMGGRARVGHYKKMATDGCGGADASTDDCTSWNAAHAVSCNQTAHFYCFAADPADAAD